MSAAARRWYVIARASGRPEHRARALAIVRCARRGLDLLEALIEALDGPEGGRRMDSIRPGRCCACARSIMLGDPILYLGSRRALCVRCVG